VWSLAYFRFWLVKTLLILNPLPHLLVDTPLYALYLRALGARIGSRVLVVSQHIPVCTDLLSIGPDTVIHKDAYFNGYRARAGVIEIGSVTVGENVFVGERTVLDICTTLEDDAQLGHASSLQAGQVVPAGQCWYGSPAQPAPADYDYRTVAPASTSRLCRVRYAAGRVLLLLLVLAPLEAAVSALLLTHPELIEHLPLTAALVISAAVVLGAILASLILAIGVPRLLTRALKPGKVYPLYGFHFTVQRLIARTSNNPLMTGLLGDSCAIVHYLRVVGYRFGAVEQTGSNFGLDVKHEIPALSHVGTGTMASDGLSIMNAEFSSTAFRVMPVAIGKRNYIGNAISYPAAARTGDNVLFGSKAMVPIGGPKRSDVGLLGSPCFEIPRSVLRDKQFDEISTGAARERRLAAKTRHNVVTMGLHLLVDYLLVLGLILIAASPLGGTGMTEWAGTVASTVLELMFTLGLFVLVERAVTGFRPLQPSYCSIYQVEFWRHERFWKVAPTNHVRMFDGTPFKSVMWRLLGVPVGRRVFDDGLTITERTLVRIGSESTFNMGSSLQSHTLEDGTFKSDHITVGNRCTVGTAALVNYGAVMEDGSVLDPDSFLMKGSRVEPAARWRGNPATEVPNDAQEALTALPAARRAELQAAL
jgi:non-ribosomal peptide synthetase-like protein